MTIDRPPAADLVKWDVVEEHLHEAEFLYELWQVRQRSPHYTFRELVDRLEPRLEAHLDGLLVGGPPVAQRLLLPLLEAAAEPGEATVAALVLLRSDRLAERRAPLETVVGAQDDQRRALEAALTVSDGRQVDAELLQRFEGASDPDIKVRWLELLSARLLDPGPSLAQCFDTGHPPLTSAALVAAGRAGRRDLLRWVEPHFEADDDSIRRAAILGGLPLGSTRAWNECLRRAEGRSGVDLEAMELTALLGDRRDHDRLALQLEVPGRRPAVLWALGFCGSVEVVDRCRPWLASADERTAKLAAEALAATAGIDLFDRALRQPPIEPVDQLPPLEEDDLDADLVPNGVDQLPLVDPDAMAHAWDSRRRELSPSKRYIEGELASCEALTRALWDAPSRRRHLRGLELLLRTGGGRRVATSALSAVQRPSLRELQSIQRREFVNAFGGQW